MLSLQGFGRPAADWSPQWDRDVPQGPAPAGGCGRRRSVGAGIRTGLGAFLAVALTTTAAAAQTADTVPEDTTVLQISGITVRAVRPVTTVGGASATEVRLDSLSLSAAPTLEEVLREIPAIHVRTNSRGEAEISVRGSDSRQVAVLVDGVPLTLGWDSRTDVSVVPATAARELTLIRGLSSILYGPNTLGGIVELGMGSPAFAREPSSLQLTAGADHVGGYASSATLTLPMELENARALLRAGGGYRTSPGSTLASGVVERANATRGLRLNTDLRHVDGFLSARYSADGGAWGSVSASGYSAERGVAAELGVAEPRLWRYPRVERGIAVVSGGTGHRRTPLGGVGDLEGSLGVDLGRSDIDAYSTHTYSEVIGEEDGDDRTYTLRLLGDHTAGPHADLRAAFTYADIDHRERLTDEPEAHYRQRLWSVGAETVARPLDRPGSSLDNLRVSVGGVLDIADTPASGDKPPLGRLAAWGGRVGATAAVAGGDALLHVGVSRRARFPSLRELYSGALGRFEPNPDLTAERLVAAEAGATMQLVGGELQVVAFHHRLSDAVARIRTQQGLFRRINRHQIRSTGLELMASGELGPFSLFGDVTLQEVDLIDPLVGTSAEPENQPALYGRFSAMFDLPLEVRARAESLFTGGQFCLDPDTGDDRRLAGGIRADASLSRVWRVGRDASPLLSRLETVISVDNIGDTALYDQCGLPREGRILRMQLRLF